MDPDIPNPGEAEPPRAAARRAAFGPLRRFLAAAIPTAAAHGGVILGLCGVVVLWVGVTHLLSAEREQALQGAAQNTSNLSRAFEEQIVSAIKSVDQTLLYVRDAYEQDPRNFDATAWTRKTQAITNLTFQIAFIGRDGFLKSSNLEKREVRMDLSDREHFRVQRDSPDDRLFISKPVMGRASGKWSIQMTRKLVAADGSFDGVIVVSFDPLYLSQFYDSVDVGGHGAVMLVGADGVVRAIARARTPHAPSPASVSVKGGVSGGAKADNARTMDDDRTIGRSLTGDRLLEEYAKRPSGTFDGTSRIDDVKRITSYRGVRGYPLIVSIGVSEAEVLAAYQAHRTFDYALAIVLSALLLSVALMIFMHQSHLGRARGQLAASEAAHARKSALLETTLEHMSQGLMMVDAEHRVQVCNERAIEMLGLPPELVASRSSFEEVLRWQWDQEEFGRDGGALDEGLRGFVLAGGIAGENHAYERSRPNGLVLEIRSTPMWDGGFVRTYTDITERKNTEIELRAARDKADGVARAKSEFLATMSHEIRSPMSGLVGVLELLRDTRLDADQSRMAAMVHSSALSLLSVLNEILDFSKIEAGALTIVLEPARPRELLNDLIQPHALHAARKGLNMTLNLAPELPECAQIDPLRLRQILNNLLSNAIKFTAAGQISLDVDVVEVGPASLLRFAVRDTGIGMSAEVTARLFEPFMQADGSTTRDFGGTGLGLCISQRLAKLLDGALSVASRKGEGSVFTLLLPLTAAVMPAPSPLAAQPRNKSFAGAGRVLVVDDDITNRWLTQRQLVQLGLTVEVAEDGEVALAMLQAGRYRLLVTDCHMPRMDGDALARIVRASPDPALSDMPIIGLTADVTAAQRERCLDAGMSDVGYKPLSRDRLFHLLARHLPQTDVEVDMAEPGRSAPPPAEPAAAPDAGLEAGGLEAGGLEAGGLEAGGPAFDGEFYRELFPPGDPDGPAWLSAYLESAEALDDELDGLLGAEPLDRKTIIAAAHRLAGNSLSAGATRLGEQARRLEQAAPAADPAELKTLQAGLRDEFIAARQAILAFIATVQLEPAT